MANRLFDADDGMDEDVCLQIYDNDYDFYRLVLDTFRNEIVKTVEAIKEKYEAGDTENYRILVHGLKGAGGSAGAKHLVELATKSNALIKEGKWDEAVKYHDRIVAELERLIILIPKRLEEAKDNTGTE